MKNNINRIDEALMRDSTKRQMMDLKKTIDAAGGDIESKVRKGSKTKEYSMPNAMYMDNPFGSNRQIDTCEHFSKNDANNNSIAAKSTQPKGLHKMRKFEEFKNESVKNPLNESSKTDFMVSYSDELKSAYEKIQEMSDILEKVQDEFFDNTFDEVEKKMSTYDSNVGPTIEKWIAGFPESKSISIDDIVDFALDNQYKYGTEPQFVLFAIDDMYNIVKKYENTDINESKNEEEIYLTPKQRKLPEGLKKGIIKKMKKSGKKLSDKEEDKGKDKKEDKEPKKDEKKNGSDEEKYLTPKQRKLPEGLKKGIIARAKKKSKVNESKKINEPINFESNIEEYRKRLIEVINDILPIEDRVINVYYKSMGKSKQIKADIEIDPIINKKTDGYNVYFTLNIYGGNHKQLISFHLYNNKSDNLIWKDFHLYDYRLDTENIDKIVNLIKSLSNFTTNMTDEYLNKLIDSIYKELSKKYEKNINESKKEHITTKIDNWIQDLDNDVIGTTDDKIKPMFVNRPNRENRPSYDILRAGKYITIDNQDCEIIGLKNGELLVDFINKDNKHEVKKLSIKDALKIFNKMKKNKE